MGVVMDATKIGFIDNIQYCPDFITPEAEERYVSEVVLSKAKWTTVSGRRLQNHGGIVHAKGLIRAPLPTWLETLCKHVHAQLPEVHGGSSPNHVLVNAYDQGQGIMPHADGPSYFSGVCILSLGGPAVMRFHAQQEQGGVGPPIMSVVLMPRSLLVFSGEAYTHHLHSIDAVHEDLLDDTVVNAHACGLAPGSVLARGSQRISLTFRRVAKVLPSFFKPP